MNTDAYIAVLVIGVVLVAIDGQLIYRSGRRYMEKSDAASGTAMVKLVTVLFHLAVLGILALLSTIDFGADFALTTIVSKIGVLLIVLAIAHGIAMAIIANVRDEQVAQAITSDNADPGKRPRGGPAVDPVPDSRSRDSDSGPRTDYGESQPPRT